MFSCNLLFLNYVSCLNSCLISRYFLFLDYVPCLNSCIICSSTRSRSANCFMCIAISPSFICCNARAGSCNAISIWNLGLSAGTDCYCRQNFLLGAYTRRHCQYEGLMHQLDDNMLLISERKYG